MNFSSGSLKRLCTKRLAGVLFLLSLYGSAAFAQQVPVREMKRIAGNLYRFRNNFHYSVFLVTPSGIIVTDPINRGAATWLRAELGRRFGRPVKYLIYSHDHSDHIAGGEVFADTAVVIAHERAKRTIIGEKRPTAVPDVTFSDRLTIELGGETVRLQYVGRGHSDNLIVMNFPAEHALFAVDVVSVRSLPYRTLSDSYFPDWMDALKRIERMDFEVLVPGHGPMGTKRDVREHRGYLEDLYAAVLKGARSGRSLRELKEGIKLEKYRGWARYKEWLPLNIEGMYRNIQLHRRGN